MAGHGGDAELVMEELGGDEIDGGTGYLISAMMDASVGFHLGSPIMHDEADVFRQSLAKLFQPAGHMGIKGDECVGSVFFDPF